MRMKEMVVSLCYEHIGNDSVAATLSSIFNREKGMDGVVVR